MIQSPKVLVAIPSYPGDAHARIELVTALGNMRGDFDVVFVWNGVEKPWGLEKFRVVHYTPPIGATGHEILAAKEKLIRTKALKGNYSHLLMLESDNIPKPDTLAQLLSHGQGIVSAVYFIRAQQEYGLPLADLPGALALGRSKGFDENTMCYFARNEVIPTVWGIYTTSVAGFEPRVMSRLWTLEDLIDAQQHKLIKIAGAGVGCVLISREVLIKTAFLNSEEYTAKYGIDVKTHTDYIFYAEAKRQGFDSFLDPNHIVKHLHEGLSDERVKWFGVHESQSEEVGPVNKYKAA